MDAYIDSLAAAAEQRVSLLFDAAKSETMRYISELFARPEPVRETRDIEDENVPAFEEYMIGRWSRDELFSTAERSLRLLDLAWMHKQHKHDPQVKRDAQTYLKEFPMLASPESSAMRVNRVDMKWGLPSVCVCVLDRGRGGFAFHEDSARVVVTMLIAVSELPPMTWPGGPGYAFRFTEIYGWAKDRGGKTSYVTIDREGNVYPAMYAHFDSQQIQSKRAGEKHWYTVSRPRISPYKSVCHGGDASVGNSRGMTLSGAVALTVSAWRHREWEWNVVVGDDRGKVSFPLQPALVKKLFTERDIDGPGKRKALLHWVSAHRRRTGSNVKTHIRGNTSFSMRNLRCELGIPGKHWPMLNDDFLVEDYGGSWGVPKGMNLQRTFPDSRVKELTMREYVSYSADDKRGQAVRLKDYTEGPSPRGYARYFPQAGMAS